MTLRNYGNISLKQTFPNEIPPEQPIQLTFYWFMQEIYTNLLSLLVKEKTGVETKS